MVVQEEDSALLAAHVLCVHEQHILRNALLNNGLVALAKEPIRLIIRCIHALYKQEGFSFILFVGSTVERDEELDVFS